MFFSPRISRSNFGASNIGLAPARGDTGLRRGFSSNFADLAMDVGSQIGDINGQSWRNLEKKLEHHKSSSETSPRNGESCKFLAEAYNALLKGLVRQRNFKSAEELLQTMRRQKLSPCLWLMGTIMIHNDCIGVFQHISTMFQPAFLPP